MIYCKSKRLIFIHIPKTAGSSIQQAITQAATFGLASNRIANTEGLVGHLSAKSVRRILGETEYKRCWSFSVVRNPWDRMVSLYTNHVSLGLAESEDFSRWLPALLDSGNVSLYRQQYRYLFNDKGKQLVDKVFRFERLNDVRVALSLHFGRPVTLMHIKKMRRKPYRDFYDAATCRLIESMFGQDIEQWEYTF